VNSGGLNVDSQKERKLQGLTKILAGKLMDVNRNSTAMVR
jgi:hypothetical protein